MDPGILLVTLVVVMFAVKVAERYWRGDWVIRRAKQATRAAKSGENAAKASVRLSNASAAFSNAASQAARRAQQAKNRFSWWYWCSYAGFLLFCSRWYIGRSMRLRDRAKSKLQRCDAILNSLGAKPDP